MYIDDNVLRRLEQLKKDDVESLKSEIEKIDKQLFEEYCFKKKYKDKCDAAFCVAAQTDTCQYLKEMRKIWNILTFE